MQCIFNFSGSILPNWNSEVLKHFPLIGELNTPWRWINAGAPALGEWVLAARESLKLGARVDLQTCPAHVIWHPLTDIYKTDRTNQHNAQHFILNSYPTDSLLVIGSSMDEQSRHDYAQGNQRIEVVEPIQLLSVTRAGRAHEHFTINFRP